MYYNICKLTVEFSAKYPMLQKRAEKYRIAEGEIACKPDFSLAVTDSEIDAHIAAHPDCNAEFAEYVLYGIKFYNKISDYNAFFLHSSAVAYNGNAYLFTAPCGGGKSTHARIWRTVFKDCAAINDDKPVIRKISGKLFACGTPFSGKHDLNANLIIPLKAVCVVNKAEKNHIERLAPVTAAPLLLEQTLRSVNTERAEALLTILDEMLSNIPVYNLHCNTEESAAYTSYEAMSIDENTDGFNEEQK